MDVKFVPRECNKGECPEEWLYQYTMIDEATRERFIYPYKEHCGFSTVDFIKRALVYFGYLPEVIQTDNGTEFTNPKGTGEGKVHIVDKLLNQLKIKHQLKGHILHDIMGRWRGVIAPTKSPFTII